MTKLLVALVCLGCCARLSVGQDGADLLTGLASLLGGGAGVDSPCLLPCSVPLVPKDGYVPVSNGCGTESFKLDMSAYPKLVSCCHKHDLCYARCDTTRNKCDRRFEKCLTRRCSKHYASDESCQSTVAMMSMGVKSMGCGAYLQTQKEACVCADETERLDL